MSKFYQPPSLPTVNLSKKTGKWPMVFFELFKKAFFIATNKKRKPSIAFLFVIALLAFKESKAQTTLAQGDVAVIAINSANPDKFSFVFLKDVAASTVVNFTDNGFTAGTTGRTGEGFLTYTVPSGGHTAGTVINWTNGQSITGTGWSSNNPTNFAFNGSGDQLFAFQGSTANWASQSGITLLFGINYGTALSSTSGAANTVQPTSLTSAFLNLPATTNANGYFANGSTSASSVSVSGTQPALLTLFVTAAKWFGTSGTAATFPSFTISVSGSCVAPTLSATTTGVSCFGGNNGAVDLTLTGGTAPFTYSWSNGSTTEDITGIAAGNYSVTVTATGGCTATASYSVNQPAVLTGSVTTTTASCGNLNGSVNLTTAGGTAPYTYSWSNGATTEDLSNVASGTYNVTITDANGCTALANAVVNNADGPSASAIATNTNCINATGSIDLTVTGGTAPYTYLWSNGETTEDLTINLAAGTYSVIVTDANGCTTTANATVMVNGGADPVQPSPFTTKTTFVYQGDNSVVYTIPPVPDVTYEWSYGGTGATINGIGNSITIDFAPAATSGTLSVVAKNACGVTSAARTLAITVNTPITLNTSNLDYSFVTVGCNRVDYLDTAFSSGDVDYSTGASTANVYQLKRLFTEISHLNPLPKFLIMTGDIVMGYKTPSTPDTAELAKQLTAWKAIYENHPLSKMGITLVTVPGNHETQDKAAGKKSFLSAEQIFTRVMSPYIVASNGPGIGGADGLSTDQSKLTYSFDYGGDHYIILNTDPVGKDNQVPYKWLSVDIQNARANNARHIFAFGHKPAYSSPLTPAGGLDAATTLAARDSMWKYLEDNNCEALFSAHEHLWDSVHPHAGKTWQVISGNGGSRVEPVWVGAGKQYYGYTIVNIYNDRKLNVMGVGRNTAQSSTAGGTPYPVVEDENPSTVRNSFDICLTTRSSSQVTTCGSYVWNNTRYTTSGLYTFTTTNSAGCDSIATLVLTISDTIPPTITAPPAVTACTNLGCTASGVLLGTPVTGDNCAVASIKNNAPSAFPLGSTIVTWTVTDSSGNTATATQTVTVTDGTAPSIYINQTGLSAGVTGPSSSASPYVIPTARGVKFTSILSVGDSIGGYRMAGIPDGLGAFDNCDGTFTLLMNHEIGNTLGSVRAHGGIGAFVSKWIINKSNLQVQSGSDLMQQVYFWNNATQSSNPAPTSGFAFNRFCSADLPAVSAYYNSATGKGTKARIYMHGEEGGATGYQLGTVASGPDAGKAYILGKFNLTTNGSGLTGVGAWENALANPFEQDTTIVMGNNDGGTGIMANSVSMYVGVKQTTGSEVDKAGLTNGKLYFVNVAGNPAEIVNTTTRATNIVSGTPFTLSGTSSTTFSRPEDGVWNPLNPSQYFFVTTDQLDRVADGIGTQIGRSRLWRLNFTDITKPSLGGTIDLLLNGTEGHNMLDNMTADKHGHLILLEDVGNAPHNGKVWQYTIATGELKMIAKHDPARFGDIVNGASVAATAPFNQDEETSGVIDVSDILGEGMNLVVDQAHYSLASPMVEGGQLLAFFNAGSLTDTATAQDTVKVTVPFGTTSTTVSLGTPATADNCSVASVTNNAPSSFPLGTTNVTWTVTDAAGNTATAKQVVIVTANANAAPIVSITSPSNPATFNAPASITIQVNATDNDGGVKKVELYVNGLLFATDSIAPYTFSGSGVEDGVYKVVAKATDVFGASTSTDTLTITVKGCKASGSVNAEGFLNIPGDQVANLTASPKYPNNPDVTAQLTTLEYANVGDNYGGKLYGYICAPLTGAYTFYIAGNEQAGLWLSTNDNPANKVLIAYTATATNFRDYYKFPTQRSVKINLVKGARYYFETLQKESTGADHLSVSWVLPNGLFEAPIGASRISPYGALFGRPSFVETMRTAPQTIDAAKEFSVSVLPNPSTTEFTLSIASNKEDKLMIRLMDVHGRVIEKMENINANGKVQIGRKLIPGVYFAEVIQGNQRKMIKLVKQ